MNLYIKRTQKVETYLNSSEHTPKVLQSLEELITALTEGERATFSHIINSITFTPNTFDKYCSWSNESYTRNCIINNEDFELILICWSEGHRTPIHDHGGEECWVKVIDGNFREVIYQKDEVGELKAIKTTISKPNEVTYMKDFMGYHSLENISNKRSMSLHLYAKPIRECRAYDENTKTFKSRFLSYNTTI